MLDHLRIALHFSYQGMQAGKTQANDFLAMFDRLASMATGLGGLAGVAGDLLDGRLQFAKGVSNHCRVAGLVFGAAVQVIAQFRQGSTAAGDLFGVATNGPHQVHQIGAQTIERGFDVMQFAVGIAQLNVAAEVAFGPGRQGRGESGQGSRQFALQGVDQQGDQQNQADHHPLHQPHFTLDLPVLGAHHRFQPGDGLLHGGDFQVCRGAEFGTFVDLLASARQFRRVTAEQAVELTLEADAGIFGRGFLGVFQAHHRSEIIGVRFTAGRHAQQRQGVQLFGLAADVGDFALDIGGQFAATAADQFVPGQRQLAQVLGSHEQWGQVARVATGVLAELIKAGAQLSFSLQEQGLRIARELAGGQQIGFAEFVQVVQARAQGVRQGRWQLVEFLVQCVDGLAGAAQAQRIAAGEVIDNIARHVTLELLGQPQVALHQQIGAFEGLLRPPECRSKGHAHGHQKKGVEIGQQFQAHQGLPKAEW
ncbi:hypothetical protein D3C76_875230 [compost metagenome]